jgi:hypothetical protein
MAPYTPPYTNYPPWSIEEGKAFEDDHRVLARDEGFATRGDAKEAMQQAWDRLLAEGKTPGRPGAMKASIMSGQTDSFCETHDSNPKPSTEVDPQLEWAVVAGDRIVAVLATQSEARKFGQENHKGRYKLRKVTCTISKSRDT